MKEIIEQIAKSVLSRSKEEQEKVLAALLTIVLDHEWVDVEVSDAIVHDWCIEVGVPIPDDLVEECE